LERGREISIGTRGERSVRRGEKRKYNIYTYKLSLSTIRNEGVLKTSLSHRALRR
jgi:hypothetical protein